jgi:hypothetical protein
MVMVPLLMCNLVKNLLIPNGISLLLFEVFGLGAVAPMWLESLLHFALWRYEALFLWLARHSLFVDCNDENNRCLASSAKFNFVHDSPLTISPACVILAGVMEVVVSASPSTISPICASVIRCGKPRVGSARGFLFLLRFGFLCYMNVNALKIAHIDSIKIPCLDTFKHNDTRLFPSLNLLAGIPLLD